MSAVSPSEPVVEPAAEPDLNTFFAQLRPMNPFVVNRVVQAGSDTFDVPAIHDRPFRQLVDLAGQARQQFPGIGAMLWGEPGIGKSHVLARFRQWAGREYEQAIFLYLPNLQSSPEALPRSLLRCVVSMLTEGRLRQLHPTPLYRLVLAAVQRALQAAGCRKSSEPAVIAAYQQQIDDLFQADPAQAAVMDRTVYDVLLRFWLSAYREWKGLADGRAALAIHWLAGDALDADQADLLGLPRRPLRDGDIALADDQEIKNVLVALAQLAAWANRPLVLCLDQVDNLEREQFAALARFLHALIDSTGNLLVVTCGVQPTLVQWKAEKVLQDSSWDRLAQYTIELQPINIKEARQIVQARLQPLQETFRNLEPIWKRVQDDLLFPLGEAWAQLFLADRIEIRPREVINWAAEGWRQECEALQQLGGEAWLDRWASRQRAVVRDKKLTQTELQQRVDELVAHKLQEHVRQKQGEPQTLPPDADNLAGLLCMLLQRCLNVPQFASLRKVDLLKKPKHGPQPRYQLMLYHRWPDGTDVRCGVLCLAVQNRRTLAGFLRRLAQDTKPPERLVLVTDERRPLDPAAAGKDYLELLRRQYGDRLHLLDLTLNDYAQLDALQATVGLARSGDLEIDLPGGMTSRLSEQDVISSHFRQRRYEEHPLLKLLLGA